MKEFIETALNTATAHLSTTTTVKDFATINISAMMFSGSTRTFTILSNGLSWRSELNSSKGLVMQKDSMGVSMINEYNHKSSQRINSLYNINGNIVLADIDDDGDITEDDYLLIESYINKNTTNYNTVDDTKKELTKFFDVINIISDEVKFVNVIYDVTTINDNSFECVKSNDVSESAE